MVSKAKSVLDAASCLILANISRPACIAIDFGLRGDSPAAIASAFTYSNMSRRLGSKLSATVVLSAPLGPPMM